MEFFFASLKSLKKGVGSISQSYGSPDPDPHQNVTDPQHCLKVKWLINVCVLCVGAGAGPGLRRVDLPTLRLSESVPCCPPPLYPSPVNRYQVHLTSRSLPR
jgi:hypothetical protein